MLERLAKLYDRATGGSSVAADPNNQLDRFWPRAADAAGVDIATEWFERSKEHGEHSLLFLVGGPGGGKSHVSSQIVSGLEEIEPQTTSLAMRSHRYKFGKRELLLINDATIDETERQAPTLALEIEECLASGKNLIACVNRGILVEELAQIQSIAMPQAAAILDWLSNADDLGKFAEIETLAASDYLKFGKLFNSEGAPVKICVSFVDVCSLFERSPKPTQTFTTGQGHEVSLPDYRITKFGKRRYLAPSEQPATDLIVKAIEALVHGDELASKFKFDPVVANLENLSDFQLVNSLSTIMRSAEISTGQRFTYREVWGAIARSVIGDLSVTSNSGDLESELNRLQPQGSSPRDTFKSLQRLAGIRYHQALFGVNDGQTLAPRHQVNPVTKLTVEVDPVRDGQPGRFSATDDVSGWINPLLDAFASSYASGSPLESVIGQVQNDENDLFVISVTKFDRQVDDAFVEYLSDKSLKDADRNSAIRWYSTYLSRLYAVANGIPAFREQISTWVQIWLAEPDLPLELEQKFMSMLRPRRPEADDESSYIPVFDSRTISITGPVLQPKLAARLSDLKTQTRRRGDSVILVLSEHGKEIAEVLLDFSLLRDALVCTVQDVGVSDLSHVNAPRLERLRASRLAPSMLAESSLFSILQGQARVQVVIAND